ncbi:MAG TPA: hypothetical protein VE170_16285, partial [Candidatus Limnocylindria bacterium]|nr:hypothetical protein [Candidatus Limnocylindria bacterium]
NFSRQGAKTPSSELWSFRPEGEIFLDPSSLIEMTGISPTALRLCAAFAGEFPAIDFRYAALTTARHFALGKYFRLW